MAYVGDIVDGLISMMDNFDVCNGDIFNLGTEEEMSVLEHANLIKEYTNSSSEIKFIGEQEAHGNYKDIRKRKPDLIKSLNVLDYMPKYSFRKSFFILNISPPFTWDFSATIFKTILYIY